MSKSERIDSKNRIEALDLTADGLGTNVQEVDNNVIIFQKEVDEVLDEAEYTEHSFSFESNVSVHANAADGKRSRKSSKKDWDPHQHASNKRKPSTNKQHASSGNKRTKKTNESCYRSNNNLSTHESERMNTNSQSEIDFNDSSADFDVSSDVDIQSSDIGYGAAKSHSIDNDVIGETDETDDNPSIQDNTRSWQASSSRPKASSGVRRRATSKKRAKERRPTYRHIRREGTVRRAPPSTPTTSGLRPRQSRAENGMIQRADSGAGTNKTAREVQGTESLHRSQSNLTGQRGVNSWPASVSREDVVQNFLRPENLFNSLSATIPDNGLIRGIGPRDVTRDGRPQQNDNQNSNPSNGVGLTSNQASDPTSRGGLTTSTSVPLHELTASLGESGPQRPERYREILSALSNSTPSGKEEVVAIFQNLHTLLKTKCSTLLDVIRCDPDAANNHIDCWSLVFRLMEQKFHEQLPQDNILWKVFGRSKDLARHILAQVIDVLYSQIMGKAYGDVPHLTVQLFRRIRSLCQQIGAVVTLLPEVANLMAKIPGQVWHLSLVYDQKENPCENSIFVSMLDPKVHERFIVEGEVTKPKWKSRLRWYSGGNIPRKEIEGIWTIIGFFANISSHPRTEKEEQDVAKLVKHLLDSKCGVLPTSLKITDGIATEVHLDRCLHEINWLCQLYSNSLLGNLPFKDSLVTGLVRRATLLESRKVTLHMRPTSASERIDKVTVQLWKASHLGSSGLGVTSFASLFTQSKIDDVWSFMPSTTLSQTCARLIHLYAISASRRELKARWNAFTGEVVKLAIILVEKEDEFLTRDSNQPKSQPMNDVGAAFASVFPELANFSEKEAVPPPTGGYLREAACFSLLACIIAGSQSDSFVPNKSIALNKEFREKVSISFLAHRVIRLIISVLNSSFDQITNFSSDKMMQKHHKYFLHGMSGEPPKGSCNINLLFISSKVLSLTALLHLSVSNDSVERLGLDDDSSMLESLLTSIISNLSASIETMQALNLSIKETRNLFSLSKSYIHVIKSTAMWLGLIFHRVTDVIGNDDTSNCPANLHAAIQQLIESRCSLVITVLTKALSIIYDVLSTNKLGRSLNVDLALDKAFYCCLGALRKVIESIHASRRRNASANVQNLGSAFSEYQSFMVSYLNPVCQTLI